MGYKVLGFAVWQGGKWYVRRRLSGTAPKVAIIGATALTLRWRGCRDGRGGPAPVAYAGALTGAANAASVGPRGPVRTSVRDGSVRVCP